MDVEELVARAWAAVEKAGVPEPLQALALQEALDFLRNAPPAGGSDSERPRTGRTSTKRQRSTRTLNERESDVPLTEDAFFARLASESGATEGDLRDILQLTADKQVHVTTPTKDLGSSVAEQAKNVIALVAGARSVGLGERPVDAAAVRAELERKRCYDANNFAVKHLGPLKGFNAGAKRTEIVLTSKWTDEFSAAVNKAHGKGSGDSGE
jgi:hypothetical protein